MENDTRREEAEKEFILCLSKSVADRFAKILQSSPTVTKEIVESFNIGKRFLEVSGELAVDLSRNEHWTIIGIKSLTRKAVEKVSDKFIDHFVRTINPPEDIIEEIRNTIQVADWKQKRNTWFFDQVDVVFDHISKGLITTSESLKELLDDFDREDKNRLDIHNIQLLDDVDKLSNELAQERNKINDLSSENDNLNKRLTKLEKQLAKEKEKSSNVESRIAQARVEGEEEGKSGCWVMIVMGVIFILFVMYSCNKK